MDGSGLNSSHTVSDTKIEDHVFPIFTTYHHVLVVIVGYLTIVKYVGPRFMKNRKPYNLDLVIRIYNLLQMVFNLYLSYLAFELMGFRYLDFWGRVCNPVSTINNDPEVKKKVLIALHYYYINKILDTLETLFFVLRKKQSQVSFLHTYHHVLMIYSVWLTLYYFRVAEEFTLHATSINTIVHFLMYIYYFCASFGPSVQKYLWWKKYLTRIQMIQFLLGLSMFAKLKISQCSNIHEFGLSLWTFNVTTVLLLFIQYYVRTYINKKKVK